MTVRAALSLVSIAAGLALVWLLFLAPGADETSRGAELQGGVEAARALSTDVEPRASAAAVERRDEGAGAAASAPEGDLRVLCLAVDGTPVPRLEVEVRPLDRSGERPLQRYFSERADAEGRLRFAGAREVLLREEAPHGWALTTAEFRPWVAPLRLDLPRDFERVVEWRLPPFGAVEVRVLDPCGALLSERISVELEEAEGVATRPLRADSEDGLARFEYLGLALPFLLRVNWGRVGDLPERRVEALSSHGERRIVEVRLGAGATALCMRLFDADGTCLRDAELWASLRPSAQALLERSPSIGPSPRSSDGSRVFADRAGRVFLEATPSSAQLLLRDARRGQSLLVDLPALRDGEAHDLGELHLRRAEVLASGRVLAGDGAPPSDAFVEAYPLPLVGRLSPHPASVEPRSSVRCDEDGHFVLHALDPAASLPSRLLLCARDARAELRSEPLEIERGATGLEVRLSATGHLLVELLLPAEARLGWFSTRLVDAAGRDWSWSSPARDTSAPLSAVGLPPGSYALSVHLDLQAAPLVSVNDIVVPSGSVCADPRLRPLDLRPHVQVIALDLEPVDGAALALPGTLELRERADHRGATHSIVVRSPRFRTALPARPFVGTLRLGGCEPVELDLAVPRQRVVLRPR